MIGYAFCGSFCTFDRSISVLKELVHDYDVLPIMSHNAASTDTRFGKSADFIKKITDICRREPIMTIKDAEPLGPAIPLDALIIAPCTGNTLAKLANGITDTPVTMAAKAHLRQSRPLLISLATNDAMSANLKNISTMLEKKGVFFVPMKQDDCLKKPHSLVSEFEMIPDCLVSALKGKQERPLFI
ncbi:MAG: dipicolinate synthase subunit B [Clostridia bacterium]|nr:dipicolinate synthase subunit B [Clostridia bacterium]